MSDPQPQICYIFKTIHFFITIWRIGVFFKLYIYSPLENARQKKYTLLLHKVENFFDLLYNSESFHLFST